MDNRETIFYQKIETIGGGKKRLLIIDSDINIPFIESKILGENRYEILSATNGEEAVEIIKENKNIDLVLMSINLKTDIEGIEAVKGIIESRELPLILLCTRLGYEINEQIKSIPDFGHAGEDSDVFCLFSSIEMALEFYELIKKNKTIDIISNNILYDNQPDMHIFINDIMDRIRQKEAFISNKKEMEAALVNVRKLSCLTSIRHKMHSDISEGDFFQNVIIYLTKALQFPEITYPVIELDGKRFAPDESFNNLEKSLSTEIHLKNEKYGSLFVYYKEDRPFILPEEQDIVDDVAKSIETFLSDKRAEEELSENEARLRTIFEQAAVGISMSSLDGKFLRVNRRLCDMTGHNQKEMLQLYYKHITHPDDFEIDLWKVQMLLDGKINTFSVEKRYIHKNGETVWVNCTVSLVRNKNGEPENFLNIIEDISARKKAEEELQKHRENLEKIIRQCTEALSENNKQLEESLQKTRELAVAADSASIAKNQFIANISHELRTPLNGIIGMLSLINDSELNTENKKYVEIARSSGNTLHQIINEIFDLSKIEEQQFKLNINNFNLQTAMYDIIEMFTLKALKKGLTFSFEIDDRISQSLKGDSGRLRQVVMNLIYNALKSTDNGRIIVKFTIEDETESDIRLKFEITDTGIGIPDDKINKLFMPFTQVDGKLTRKYSGTGLGLAVARDIVKLMGGEIGVESKKGTGSRFWFTAVFQKQCKDYETEEENAYINNVLNERESANILLVEDNKTNQVVARSILQKLGYKTDLAANGYECIDALRRKDYNVVFMDCQMPYMDGFQTTKEIRSRNSGVVNPDTVIIALTAHAMDGSRELCSQAGMNDYISKPVNIREIEKILNKWVDN